GVASLIGLVMIIGIVVTNAIVLIDLVKQYRDRGVPMTEALKRGAIHRVRPILMTAIATILALLPMGIGITGEGGFISRPLAVVAIGGLFSSTAMTLLVPPAIYHLVESSGRRGETRVLEDQLPAGRPDGVDDRHAIVPAEVIGAIRERPTTDDHAPGTIGYAPGDGASQRRRLVFGVRRQGERVTRGDDDTDKF